MERAVVTATSELVPRGAPYVPPQCYTKTQDETGKVHNPCFTCHVDAPAPNYIRDSALQLAYEFGPVTRKNPWTNLFVDRSAEVAAQSDEEIAAYVRQDNYRALAQALARTAAWDIDGDGSWSGWLPDVTFHFDSDGFDLASDGSPNGWRAYAYYPVPGTFWPTNGSFGDALIRLPAAFRNDAEGHFDRATYLVNLATVEALIARRDAQIPELDERRWGVDLDGDGKLGKADHVAYRWKPGGGGMSYVGAARALQTSAKISLVAGLFPQGTEFAHSVHYLDVKDGQVRMAERMKELRYMKKTEWKTYGQLEFQAADEALEKSNSPDKRRVMLGSSEKGIQNGSGWRLQGFIEDATGALRPQTLEEHAFCIGCHSGVGATDDSVFSLARKMFDDAEGHAWRHQAMRSLTGIREPVRSDGRGEYSLYLERNGAGDELRENAEVRARFFDEAGRLRADMRARLEDDISTLLLPSPERAWRLDKAYRVLVREQSFARGRDATITKAVNVHRELPEGDTPTGVTQVIAPRSTGIGPVASARVR